MFTTIELNSEKAIELSKIVFDQERKIQSIESNKQYELAQIEALRQKEIARIKAEEQKQIADLEMILLINRKTVEKDIEHKKALIDILSLDLNANELKQTSEAKLEHYRNMNHAEYMGKLMSSDGYVAVKVAESIGNNSKIYYGNMLPKYFNVPGFWNLTNPV